MRRILVVLAVALAGCGPEPTVTAPQKAVVTAAALPVDLRLKTLPPGAVAVAEAKKAAKEGDAVVLRGRIGGTGDPFVAGRAVMTVADLSLAPCNALPGDTCPAPWDYCCESQEVLTANTATVEVDGSDGRPLRVGLQGWSGLEPLKTVVIVGTVGPRPEPGVFVVRATGIFVE